MLLIYKKKKTDREQNSFNHLLFTKTLKYKEHIILRKMKCNYLG